VVKALSWNEAEDHPVTAGEEALDQLLKPHAKDSKVNAMFNFSKMEASAIKDDIQQQHSLHPWKQGTSNSPLGMDKPAGDKPATDVQPAAFRSQRNSRRRHIMMLSHWGVAILPYRWMPSQTKQPTRGSLGR
jgi:hypothetical protein